MIRSAEEQKLELRDKNQKLLEELKAVKTNNDQLVKRKSELSQELKMAKEELATIID